MGRTLRVVKKWNTFFTCLQVGGLIFSLTQTSWIVREVRKAKRG
jgi:hypothetical protein